MSNSYGKPFNANTQQKRVLTALAKAGENGLTNIDFQAGSVIDGGPPIIRAATRIKELKEAGYNIVNATRAENRKRRKKSDVYVLRGEFAVGGIIKPSPAKSLPTLSEEIARQNSAAESHPAPHCATPAGFPNSSRTVACPSTPSNSERLRKNAFEETTLTSSRINYENI